MKNRNKFYSLLLGTALISGCSGKNITLQDYADKWFNEKEVTDTKEDTDNLEQPRIVILEKREEPKKNPAADIAWSSTSKADVHNKGEGALQKNLDGWMKKEWKPAFEGDTEQAEKDEAAEKHFTLQHYYDKSQSYLEKKEKKNEGKPKKPAHYETLKSLPVVGN